MRIFLLRHEIRNLRNPTFYSPLLPEGVKNANKLKNILTKCNIDTIYSSPFKRVLQTIEPFCRKNNKKINIEYSLYEQIGEHNDVDVNFSKNKFRYSLEKNDFGYELVNKRYKSYLPLNSIKYTMDTQDRSVNFLKFLIEKYKNTNKNILIASHEGILLQMMGIYEKANIPMGGLILYYDNGFFGINPLNFNYQNIGK